MDQIATRTLRPEQVPKIDPDGLDYGRDVREPLAPLWEFAFSFNGYKYFGDDEEALPWLGAFANSVEETYRSSGQLPQLGEIGMLRACLFFKQRN